MQHLSVSRTGLTMDHYVWEVTFYGTPEVPAMRGVEGRGGGA